MLYTWKRRLCLTLCLTLTLLATACGEDKPEKEGSANNGDVDMGQEDMTPQEDLGQEDMAEDMQADVPQEDMDNNTCPQGQAACLDQFGQPDNQLCEAGARCVQGCCQAQFACTQDADCAERVGSDRNCRDQALECACDVDSGQCFTRICSADQDCAQGMLCASGACVAPPEGGLQARLIQAPGALAWGDEGRALAVAYDPASPDLVVPMVPLAWSAEDDQILSVDQEGALSCAAAGSTTLTVRVADNGQDPGDAALVRCLANPEGALQLHLVQEQSGQPIAGATVLLMGDPVQTATTDEAGRAVFEEVPAQGPVSVTAVAEGFHHTSIMQTQSRDLLVPLGIKTNTNITLDRDSKELGFDQLENVDIVKGAASFGNVQNTGEIEVALTGFGINQGLLDLNFELIIGPSIEQFLPPNSGLPLPADDPIEIPGGVTLALNGRPVVANYLLTAPGGDRTIWSLGGRISLSENPRLLSDILNSAGGSLDLGRIIAAILPLFENFYSGLRPGIQMGLSPVLPPRQEDVELRVPTRLRLPLEAPALPGLGNQAVDGVIFLGGAMVPGQGFLPTGITAALDDEDVPDGRVDPVDLYMSSLHGGLQSPSARYVVASVGLAFSQIGGGEGRELTTILLSSGEPGQPLGAGLTPAREDFLGFDEADAYDPQSRSLTLGAHSDLDLRRVVLEGQDGTRWVIWLPGDATGAQLPALAEMGFPDPGAQGQGRSVQIDLRPGAQVDFDGVVSASGPQLPDLIEWVGALSILEL